MTPDPLQFYREPGPLSDPGAHAELFADLPRELGELCSAIQGLVLHLHWAPAYGVELSPERRSEANARSLSAILTHILARDPRPLCEPRTLDNRFVGTCRDFTLLLTAALRQRGVPARGRCGFGAYFSPGRFEDHWVCEHWDTARNTWVRSDAQIDSLQRDALRLAFDPLDVPGNQFLVAGRAWDLVHSGTDPGLFGIHDLRGRYFIRGNLLRDLAALNRLELLPWDGWGLMLRLGERDASDPADGILLDRVAALTRAGDDLDGLRELYAHPELRVPDTVLNFERGAMEPIAAV